MSKHYEVETANSPNNTFGAYNFFASFIRIIKRMPTENEAIVSNNIIIDKFYDVIFVNYFIKTMLKNVLNKQLDFLSKNLT